MTNEYTRPTRSVPLFTAEQMHEYAENTMAACKYGDEFCPCQDGDQCHYEGKNPMTPPPADVGSHVDQVVGPQEADEAWLLELRRDCQAAMWRFLRGEVWLGRRNGGAPEYMLPHWVPPELFPAMREAASSFAPDNRHEAAARDAVLYVLRPNEKGNRPA